MKRYLFVLLTIISCWTLSAQTVPGNEDMQTAPKNYHYPAFYAVTSVVPGLGQFLLGEPKKGWGFVVANISSIAASAVGYTAVAMRQRPLDEPQLNKTVTALWGMLAMAGNIGWVLTEVISVTDAYITAKEKRGAFSIRTAVTYSPCGGEEVLYAPCICLALRF